MSRLVDLHGRERKKPVVKLCIPYYQGIPAYMIRMMDQVLAGIPGYEIAVSRKESTVIQFVRNDMILEPHGFDYDYLFFIDNDMGFPDAMLNEEIAVEHDGKLMMLPRISAYIKRLLDADKDVIGGVYCQRNPPHLPLVFNQLHKGTDFGPWEYKLDLPEDGIEEVDAIATGFMCIKKHVFAAFADWALANRNKEKVYREWAAANTDMLAQLPRPLREFLEISRPTITPPFWLGYVWHPQKQQFVGVGEDIYFCYHAQQLGFKIWVDYSVQIGHEIRQFVMPADYQRIFMERAKKGHETWRKEHGLPTPPWVTEQTATEQDDTTTSETTPASERIDGCAGETFGAQDGSVDAV